MTASLNRLIPRHITWPQVARWEATAYVGLLIVAAAIRLWDLGSRAMHHDESLHSTYAWYLANGQGLMHDPMMHGPFQMEATAGAFFVFGDSDVSARLIYAIAGSLLVVLPFFLRPRLGTLGAIFVSALLALSPALLYFSRFARNDILMALWTLGLVVCMWRYIDEGRQRYLFVAAGVLALAFATKETAYIMTGTLGLYLVLVLLARNWPSIRSTVVMGKVSPPVALVRLAGGLWTTTTRSLSMSGLSREASFLLILITLTLPQWTAFISILQDTPLLSWSGLVLASPVGGSAPIGAPARGGLVIATLAVLAVLWISIALGTRWNKVVWLKSAVVFYVVWAILYSTFFTHPGGIGSGVWQGLGYWIVQQGEARGGQPWYYYMLITSIYEFLPLFLAILGSVYYFRRRDRFGLFLVYWAATTWILYTIASEKMPWLLVNITLPLVVLGGRFLGDFVRGIQWRRPSPALALIPLVVALLALSVQAGWRVTYVNGDVPVEMMVYTQTSPDIARLSRELNAVDDPTTLPVTVDSTSGFTWPWAWYLRSNTRVGWPSYQNSPPLSAPDASVLLVHDRNIEKTEALLEDQFTDGQRIKHRWWFPEGYKGVTIMAFVKGLFDPGAWRTAVDYFFFRELATPLGSEDAYVYFSKEFPLDFTPQE